MARLTTIEVEEYGGIDVYSVGPAVELEFDADMLQSIRDVGAIRLHVYEAAHLRDAIETAERDIAREGWTE